ncbi:MAG: patatin-like phospholipase family protein [Deltaproteobacteria bacterium]|nr:patatin-like phospholipase family protein [Deltaproteobacteria bacterium]
MEGARPATHAPTELQQGPKAPAGCYVFEVQREIQLDTLVEGGAMQEADDGTIGSDNLHAALKGVFGPLDDTLLAEISDKLEVIDVAGGTALFREGDPGDSLYILLRGRLNVSVFDPETGVEKLLGETAPGEAIGEIGLLTNETRSASLWATRDSRLVRISQTAFDALAEKNPDLLRRLAKVVVSRLRKRTSSYRFSPRVSNIAIIPARAKNRTTRFAEELQSTLSRFGSTLHLNSERLDQLVGVPRVAMAQPGSREDSRLGNWLAEEESRQRFVLLEADAEPSEWTRRCMRQADLILIVGNADDDPIATGAELELIHDVDSVRSVRHVLVLLHSASSQAISGSASWLDARTVDEHHHVRQGMTADLERLARIISGNAVGLVLGGGGARGFAHAGVYRALFERGIPIDWVGGSSIGAVFGAGMAMAWEPGRVEEEARLSFVKQNPFGDYTIPMVSLLRGKRIDRLAQRSFEGDIEDLLIPYFCVSTNLTQASLTIHDRGSLWRAIRASVSLPGVLPPTVKGKHLAIDGGILNNLPIDIMRNRSVGKVIAVDLSVGKEYELDYPEVPGPLQILLSRMPFARKLNVPGIVTLMMKATVMASAVHSKSVRTDATLLLNPPVARFGLLATGDFEEIVEVGYQHAREQLENWPPQETDPSPAG